MHWEALGGNRSRGIVLPLQTLAAVPLDYHSGTLFHCTQHSKWSSQTEQNKTKQWDTLLKLKTSQHKSIVAGFCIDVKNEAGSSRNTLNRETKYLKYVLSEAGEPALSFEQTSCWTLICLLCAHRPFGFLSLACVQSELNVNLDTRYKRRDRWLWLLSTFFL